MGSSVRSPDCRPSWISTLGTPVWISNPSGNLSYINERAGKLLGLAPAACIGRPCHEVIAGEDKAGHPYCDPDCPIRQAARNDQEIEPVDLCVSGINGARKWVQMLIIPIRGSDRNELSLVHCAVPRGKERRIEEYLAKVASRSVLQDAALQHKRRKLTTRERQILHLLAEDHDLYTIADELCISYATVRNHIQHILAKLHVHSIMEAVARHLASGLRSSK